MTNKTPEKVSILPGVSILHILRFVSYQPWFALSEFVDNALESFRLNKERLKTIEGEDYCLTVDIQIKKDVGLIRITDNAAGISKDDFPRALKTAEAPPAGSKLSEFGMGMKSAATWFSHNWKIRSKALGEEEERSVEFDIEKIVENETEELDVEKHPSTFEKHYTVIEIYNSEKCPQKRTLFKIRNHLASIYRVFIRRGDLKIKVNEDWLEYSDPEILNAPTEGVENAPSVEWKRDIVINLPNGKNIAGFAAIKETGSTKKAGFALFRNDRVILGSDEDGYKPPEIFGAPNTFPSQRLFGELHFSGFKVSHTKDEIQWDGLEGEFIDILKEQLSSEGFSLLKQVKEYRKNKGKKDKPPQKKDENLAPSPITSREIPKSGEGNGTKNIPKNKPKAREIDVPTQMEFTVKADSVPWTVHVQLSREPSMKELFETGNQFISAAQSQGKSREIGLKINLDHHVVKNFCASEKSKISLLAYILAVQSCAESIVTSAGITNANLLRKKFNDLIK